VLEAIGAPQGETGEARTGAAYPPEPWALAGDAVVSLFAVPAGRLPAVPSGFVPLRLGGRGLVAAGWVRYGAGSVIEYSELFAAVAGSFRRRLTATVTHMWVDSEASRAGGRELWGYPKEMADFDLRLDPGGTAVARAGGAEIARGGFRAARRLPRLPPAPGGTVQVVDGRPAFVRSVTGGRPVLGRGGFTPAPAGPLGFLAAGRKLATVGLEDFRATFGASA
jgi:hypothetical protein